jgi:hypothetical protein
MTFRLVPFAMEHVELVHRAKLGAVRAAAADEARFNEAGGTPGLVWLRPP